MGACGSSASRQRAMEASFAMKKNKSISRALSLEYVRERSVVKILLLGTGNSGKSTILKQFKIIHTENGLGDLDAHKNVISTNITRGLVVVGQGAVDIKEVTITISPRNELIFRYLKANTNVSIWDTIEIEGETKLIAEFCEELWSDPAMNEAMKYEEKMPMLEIPVHYFMGNIDRIKQLSYTPTQDDILQARARTSGVVSVDFTLESINCRMLDVGGQRNERKKWISHFDQVTAIMFLVSLAEYNKFLLEDTTVNRMHDALAVFKDIAECPYFEETNIILFLNKKDLFEEMVNKKISLTTCFPDFELEEGEEENYDTCVRFIENKFSAIFQAAKDNQNVDNFSTDMYPYQTMATDTNNVKTVFNLCKHIIFKNNLRFTGML